MIIDDPVMRQKGVKLRKMFVDKLGMHCFMLTGYDIFYNYYSSDYVHQLQVNTSRSDKPVEFRGIDILKLEEGQGGEIMIEIVLGGDDG